MVRRYTGKPPVVRISVYLLLKECCCLLFARRGNARVGSIPAGKNGY